MLADWTVVRACLYLFEYFEELVSGQAGLPNNFREEAPSYFFALVDGNDEKSSVSMLQYDVAASHANWSETDLCQGSYEFVSFYWP